MLDVTMDLSRPCEGRVARWVRIVLVLAVVATLALLFAGPHSAWWRHRQTVDIPGFWFRNTLALGVGLAIVAVWLPRARASRYVRLAIALPLAQVAVMLAAGIAWTALRGRMPLADDEAMLVDALPMGVVLPVLVAATAGIGWLVAPRRRRAWLHATLTLGLVHLLLLGLWLPVAAAAWDVASGWESWKVVEDALGAPRRIIAIMLVPPFAAAAALTAVAVRRPRAWRALAPVIAAGTGVLFLLAIARRHEIGPIGATVYNNLIHVVVCAALVAVGALAAVGLVAALDHRRGRRALAGTPLAGTIAGTEPVATIELASWLRGLATTAGAFSVHTARGEVPVPAGAHVVAATPLATTILHTGESVPVLRGGDHVVLAGYTAGASGDPFRASAAPIPGDAGVTVGTAPACQGLALLLWRPAVAYLVICIAVACPALAALLSDRL